MNHTEAVFANFVQVGICYPTGSGQIIGKGYSTNEYADLNVHIVGEKFCDNILLPHLAIFEAFYNSHVSVNCGLYPEAV